VPIRRLPDSSRPAPVDGPVPDVVSDFQADFVVDWQVADKPESRRPESRRRADQPTFELFYS
jgi:hypothetical protein